MSFKELQVAFKFTDADLAANREGRLTPDQLQKLRNRERFLALVVVGGAAAGVIIGLYWLLHIRDALSHLAAFCIMLVASIYPLLVVRSRLARLMVILPSLTGVGLTLVLSLLNVQALNSVAAVILFPMVIFIPLIAAQQMMISHASVDIAEHITGKIALKGIGTTSLMLTVRHRMFSVTSEQVLALRNGETYTVYCSPNAPVILSIEPAEFDETFEVDAALAAKPKRKRLALGDDGELIEA